MSGERILVVDDAADMREFVINYVLKPAGFRAAEARDGLEALQMITANPPDLVILDLNMPRLDGLGVLQRLQEQRISVPVILLTFHGSEEIAISVFRMGVKDYVIKPFNEEELLGAIQRALIEARLKKERDTLYKLGKVVAGLPDEPALLKAILQAAADLTDLPEVALLLVGQDGKSLYSRAVMYNEQQIQIVNDVVQHPLAWESIRTGKPASKAAEQDRLTGRQVIPLCVPLVVGNTAVGALAVLVPIELAVDEQARLLDTLADYAAIGLERARLAALVGR